ncbi:hypothetical protein KFL_015870010 [Klebsormidium nitens]|uniref:Uncharacterized protein n=1 Tax=Klebsormidium nitens TaxID=105231 RepID=A0A1Y1IS50_KLENI|nr:hypothetical protein KFL_015870010 [Klebsormidium nitens]|eukprot:GAQ93503.1 hypothetical protein KFL_015870010 [Klebsormidium nitens]
MAVPSAISLLDLPAEAEHSPPRHVLSPQRPRTMAAAAGSGTAERVARNLRHTNAGNSPQRVQETHKSDSEGGQFQNPQDNVASISQQDVPTILSQGMDVSPQAPMLVAMPVAEQNNIIDVSEPELVNTKTDDELTSEHVGRTSSKLAAFREKTEKLRKYDPTDRKKKTARWKKRKLGATLCIGNRRIPSEGKGKKKSRADSVGKVDKVMIALDCLHKPMQDEKQVDRVLAWIDRADAAQRAYVERRKAEPPKVTKVKKPTAQDVADALNKNTEAFKTTAWRPKETPCPVNGDQPTEAQDQGAEEGAGPLDDDDNELDERDVEHEAAAESAHEDEDAEDDADDFPQEKAAKPDPAAAKPLTQPAVQISAAHSSPQRSSTPVQSAPAQTSAPLEAPA